MHNVVNCKSMKIDEARKKGNVKDTKRYIRRWGSGKVKG